MANAEGDEGIELNTQPTDGSPDPIAFLKAIVAAHAVVGRRGTREPILYIRVFQGEALQHPGLDEENLPAVDDALLEELHGHGLIDLDAGRNTWQITPTRDGRELVEAHERISSTEPAADPEPVLVAVDDQSTASNKMAWPAVRPVLGALRDYWEAAGFSQHGIQLAPFLHRLPEEQQDLFAATIRTLERNRYVEPASDLGFRGIPAEVGLTDRTHEALDGWPGAAPEDLVENLLAVLAQRIDEEPDDTKKKRLEKLRETVRELGTSLTAEVLSKVMLGD